eukprot:GFUD01139753.1.p1 GENE.GFUD01139753.1~~GFUD01139753.1.p1  ORF type:complete len:341 (-),score=94.58 GFUD01139753.1:102-1124(-)
MVIRSLLVLVLVVVGGVTAYDKYQDALDKYAKWQREFGVPKRKERNSVVPNRQEVASAIFVPHRRQFLFSSPASFTGLESELISPDVIRNTRNHQDINEIGLGGAEYISSHGTPLYKLRKRYPHYGRRRRDVETVLSRKPRQSRWTLLDPATGRPIKPEIDPLLDIRTPAVQRPNRNTGQFRGGAEYISADGTPLYKLRKRYPHYGRRRRDVETVLSRKPRQSPWTLLDPATGRVIRPKTDPLLEVDTPALERQNRNAVAEQLRDGSEYLTADGTPLYKLKKRHPLGYGRRRRDAERILHRVPRQQRGALFDPHTGRSLKNSSNGAKVIATRPNQIVENL